MARYFTTYWTHDQLRLPERYRFDRSGSNAYRRAGVESGDVVYVFSIRAGQVYLGGRMVVDEIVSRTEAIRRSGNHALAKVREWILAKPRTATVIRNRRLDPSIARKLLFGENGRRQKILFFEPGSKNKVDRQALRGVRRLDRSSADLLDRIIRDTDTTPHATEILVTPTEVRYRRN